MKRVYVITLLSAISVILAAFLVHFFLSEDKTDRTVKVGFVYVGDTSTAYTRNFENAQRAIEKQYGSQVDVIAKYNIAEDSVQGVLQELVDSGCELIFSTSYGFGEQAKEYAKRYPDVQFCQATCSNANEEPKLSNYHTYMGSIYQGRYISGVVAGMKLKELIDVGTITAEEAKVGYIGAYPYAEVISGYTAFFLGIKSVVPQATMTVKYTNTWGSYAVEKRYATELIHKGCVVISQHSDTTGPAVACEQAQTGRPVYHVSYNQSTADVAPTSYLVGCRINWEPYISSAVQAVLSEKNIEDCVRGNVNGNDIGAGFEEDWVQMMELNEIIAAKGTKDKVDELIDQFKQGSLQVFQGNYIGVNPEDATDILDLKEGYKENEKSSAPTFHYILKDVITVEG